MGSKIVYLSGIALATLYLWICAEPYVRSKPVQPAATTLRPVHLARGKYVPPPPSSSGGSYSTSPYSSSTPTGRYQSYPSRSGGGGFSGGK